MEQKRSFISIPISDTNDFSKILYGLRKHTHVKYSIVLLNNYHFTLHFFGPRISEEILLIESMLSEISFDPFVIELGDFDTLPPNPKRARVFIVKPRKGYEKFEELGMQIREKLIENGHSVDQRKFVPHLTVGRIRSKGNPEKLVASWLEHQLMNETQHRITRFVLMESILTSHGSIYKEIRSFRSVNQN